jgi:DNA transformation protein
MGMAQASDEFLEFLRERLAPLGPIATRRMFGKVGVFHTGVMFGMVADDTLYLRVDAGNADTFAEAREFPPLNYAKGGKLIDLAFWRLPDRLLDEPEALPRWAGLALAAARRVAAQRGRSAAARGR